jgi:hypothetical protein
MTLEWPYNLPIWRTSHEAISPNGRDTASMPLATEVSMGNPTIGDLLLQSGLRVPMCNPSFIWSDDSMYLVVPQYFNRLRFLRRQRLLIIDVHNQTAFQLKDIAYYFQPLSFNDGILRVIKEPFKKKEIIEHDFSEGLNRLNRVQLDWPQNNKQRT